ncbi:GEVED domain-containing protein [Marinoscillum pacificum]|uniref:GEVED domain-containing protein n=1 Tax=Marinoscillum pacificum TaxID=392723 RepID=UPI00215708D7|nr:GEVED domain-containing protein [Marinoscillum pacificum]
MKKPFLLMAAMLYMAFTTVAQDRRACAADEVYERQNNNPKVRELRSRIEEQTQRFMANGGQSSARTGILTIPVIVHVIYNTSQQNISDAQIQSQIDVMTEDFRLLNSDVGLIPSEFAPLASDIQIEFSLAQITRKQSSRASWGTNDAMKSSSQGGVDVVNPDEYLNIWVCNIGGGILGYAQFPGGPASTDGVVISPNYFGSIDKQAAGQNFYLSSPFNKGRTATHEVGHYLNLRHIWGDGGCTVDDFVSDTPTAGAANYGCPSYPSKSCSSNGGFTSDMFMNYMDYVDDACMFMFSAGQKARMDALFEPGGSRENLGSSSGGCSLAAPSSLSSSNIQDNSFTLSWGSVSGAASYDVNVDGTVTNTSSTSISITGLTAGTTYSVQVRSVCSDGTKGAYSAGFSITTTGSNCNEGPVTLSLTLDNYPSETSWTLTKDGSTVASGSGYSTNGQTITENFDFGAGSYSFTINDSYGDGICCSYGSGSYSLTDDNNNVIVSGGAFGNSESTSFCLEGSSGGDTQAPTTPTGLSSSNVSTSSVTLSWSASSDNVGVTGYNVYQNGSLIASPTATNLSVTGLSPETTYSFTVTAEDAAGNVSAASSALSVTTDAIVITYCTSSGNNSSYEWIDLVQLGAINNSSAGNGGYGDFTSQSTTLAPGSSNTVYFSAGFSGSSYSENWKVYIDYNQDGDFTDSGETVVTGTSSNGSTYSGNFTVPASASLGSTRMRVVMRWNSTAQSCGSFSYGEVEDYTVVISSGSRGMGSMADAPASERLSDNAADGMFMVYPSPAVNTLGIELGEFKEISKVRIFDLGGQLMKSGTPTENKLDVSDLKSGLYLIEVTTERGKFETKFLKE